MLSFKFTCTEFRGVKAALIALRYLQTSIHVWRLLEVKDASNMRGTFCVRGGAASTPVSFEAGGGYKNCRDAESPKIDHP